jgi:hypothetical protein
MAEDPRKLTWQAPEFEHRPKTNTWYWATILIAILLLTLAIWQKNYFFAVFIVIAELMLLVWGSSEPPMVTFALDHRGLTIGGTKFYPFHDIKSWSVDSQGFFDPAWPDIFLHIHGHFHIGLRIKVPPAILEDVEERLRERVQEVPFQPSAIDVLEKLLGF